MLAGPHTGNAPDVARLLEGAGGLARVRDAGELAATLLELLGNPAQARRAGEAAAAVVAANGGATTRALEAITAVLRARQEQQEPGPFSRQPRPARAKAPERSQRSRKARPEGQRVVGS